MNHCVVCDEPKNKEPLCLYQMTTGVHKICSYGCWCKRNTHKYSWLNLVNKEDFLQCPVPMVNRMPNDRFHVLSDHELDQMSKQEIKKYMDDLDEYFLFDPELKEIQVNDANDSFEDDYISSESGHETEDDY